MATIKELLSKMIDEIKENEITERETIELLAESNLVDIITDENGDIIIDSNGDSIVF